MIILISNQPASDDDLIARGRSSVDPVSILYVQPIVWFIDLLTRAKLAAEQSSQSLKCEAQGVARPEGESENGTERDRVKG